MVRALFAFAASGLSAAASAAQPLPIDPVIAGEHRRDPISFRLVDDRAGDPAPLRRSGMIAHRTIAPRTTLGVGVFKMAPKRLGAGEWRIDGKMPRSRRAAVSLQFDF